jgi:lipopolysaccharide transport system ATP-binding protein
MSDVIKVENLYKQYRLGQVSTGSIAHDLNRWWHTVRGKEDPYEKITGVNNREDSGTNDYVWALQDINFSVKQGEVLGIIGRNGAGKSTLLKILSKVTSPTKGNIKVKGRIASLLEVGTGFHPELTGRENIFLNGAILGMTKSEIRSKFDEIVAFSGVEKYIDTPVKRYSSGMYVRLAFAVAAHLEPEILIVDEVLAVGDAEFQKKCLGKMKDVSGEGRTVLFVSHNMPAVKSLCQKSLVLNTGEIIYNGNSQIAVGKYLQNDENLFNTKNNVVSKDKLDIPFFGIKSKSKEYIDIIERNDEIEFNVQLNNQYKFEKLDITFKIKGDEGVYFLTTSSKGLITIEKGFNSLIMTTPKNFFNDGIYFIDLFIVVNDQYSIIYEKDVLSFTVSPENKEMGTYMGRELGFILTDFKWTRQ